MFVLSLQKLKTGVDPLALRRLGKDANQGCAGSYHRVDVDQRERLAPEQGVHGEVQGAQR